MIIKGLLIKEVWGRKLLSGEKTWEIRNGSAAHRGPTEICYSGTKRRWGKINLVDYFPLTRKLFEDNLDKHCILPGTFDLSSYATPHVWVFKNPEIYDKPIPFSQPRGVVIWVNIDTEVLVP